MIGTLDIKCFAAKPQMPLQPMFAFAGSPSSIRVMDVPKKIGDWEITGVKVAVTYPDNRTIEKSAVRTGSVWVATLEGSEIAGKVGEGFSVVADGIDEDGNEVTGYVLGKGDVFILENRNDIKSLVDKVAVRFLEDMPTEPAAGDMIEFNGVLKFYDGEKWVSVSTPTKLSQLENDVGYITESAIPSDVSAFNNDVGYITAGALPSKVSELENDVGYITASAVPTKVSELENDAGYITESAIPSEISAFNNDVGYITAEAIPSKVSEFENDAGYVTASAIPSQVSEFENDAGYITASAIPSDVSYFNNDVGYVTASAIPSQVSELDNDAGYITASAIPSNVGAFTNDVGYLTASSTEFKNKRDYDDLTYGGTYDPTDAEGYYGITSWHIEGYKYNGQTVPAFNTTAKFKNNPTYGTGWNDGGTVIHTSPSNPSDFSTLYLDGFGNAETVPFTLSLNKTTYEVSFMGGEQQDIILTANLANADRLTLNSQLAPITASVSAIGSSVSAMASSLSAKRDYDDQTFPMPSDVTVKPFVNAYDNKRWARAYVQKFDVTYDGVGHELSDFIIHHEYGMMWYKASTLFMATRDGETFYLRDNNTNIMATTTIYALKSGVVDFTYDGKSGSITLFAREKTNFALDYQTINGYLVLKANGTTVGGFDPQNPIESEINIPVPSNVSQLNNDAGYLTAQTVASSYYNKTQVDNRLSQKQDALDEDELTMIGQVTDERKTIITFTDNTSEEYEWSGEIKRQNIVDAGLWDVDHGGWIREPLSIKVGTAVTRLGNYAFANAHQLTSIDIPSTVTSIGMYCLYDCSALTGITIPYSMKTIGSGTFGLCSSLTSVTIPNSVESIGVVAFENCTSLSTLLIPDSVTSIGNMAFTGCTNLTNLKIPDNVTSIGDGAFWGSGIQTITIGSSVASIGENAFRDASGVTSVVFRGKTLTQVQAMANYPWGINNTTQIKTWNDTSKEYVDSLVGDIDTALDSINGEII